MDEERDPSAEHADHAERRGQDQPGPGVAWLAARSGRTTEELLADPARLVAALGEAGRGLTGVAVDLRSDDPDVRSAAEREAEALRRRFGGAPDPLDRFRGRITQALREATARVRDAQPGREPPDGGGTEDDRAGEPPAT